MAEIEVANLSDKPECLKPFMSYNFCVYVVRKVLSRSYPDYKILTSKNLANTGNFCLRI